jgi:CBS domain-containing protein
MSAGRICTREVHFGEPDESVRDGARRLAEREVGTLVILDAERRPLGMVTDRDIMFHCVAEGRDPEKATLREIMASPAVTVVEETPIERALETMARDGVRRLVVVDREKKLVGLLALDDVLELLAEETSTIGKLISARALK